jgi:nucleotide-binding universal stress UspA family protein
MTGEAPSPGAPTFPSAGYRAVLVTLDGSEHAERALEPGAWLAERFNAELHILAADIPRDERLWYERYLDAIVERRPGTVAHYVREPDVAKALRVLCRDLGPCVVCMATHGRSRSAAVLGSTFTSVSAANLEPMVAIGPAAALPADDDPRRIVVCLDGSAGSEQVLSTAAAWARALGYSLSLVTVTEDGETTKVEEHLQSLAQRPELDGLAVDVLALEDSRPHAALVRHVSERPASMFAATTSARSGLDRVKVGSEVARIIHESPVPVLVQGISAG